MTRRLKLKWSRADDNGIAEASAGKYRARVWDNTKRCGCAQCKQLPPMWCYEVAYCGRGRGVAVLASGDRVRWAQSRAKLIAETIALSAQKAGL